MTPALALSFARPRLAKGKTVNPDLFVLTLDGNGEYKSVWQIGGKDTEGAYEILFDGSSLYLQGIFVGTTDFDPGPGTVTRTSTLDRRTPTSDFFLARYSTTGALAWVQTIGNTGLGTFRLTNDGDSLYLTGYFKGARDFDPGPASATLTSVGGSFDAVVAKYRKSDGGYDWAKQYGATGDDYVQYSVVDEATGMLYVGGWFTGAVDFNPGGAGGELTTAGLLDGFLLKLDVEFGNYEHVWQVSGPSNDSVRPIGVLHAVVDGVPQSTVIATGGFQGTAIFPTGGTLTSSGSGDIYLMALEEGALSSPMIGAGSGSSLATAQDVDLALLAMAEEWSTTSTSRKTRKW